MEKVVVFINGSRDGYSVDQVMDTMTVGELIECLSQFDEDAKVYLNNDNGYTYGGITWGSVSDDFVETEEDEEEVEE